MPSTTQIDEIRQWARMQDAHVRAAVDLLAEHGSWLRRADFITAAAEKHGSVQYISWRKAREFLDSDPLGSTSELAILDLAVAMGENRYRFSIMGPGHAGMILDAMRTALGITDGD